MASVRSGYSRRRSGTPPVWSPCQWDRKTCDREMERSLRVESRISAHSGIPWPVSIISLCDPVPTIYVFVPCKVNYMWASLARGSTRMPEISYLPSILP